MPDKVTIHRVNGESATMYAIDARQAVRDHPKEWSYTPFSDEQQKAAQQDSSIVPRPIVPSEHRGPFN
ncbi:hypothetical protein [Rhizobium sp. SYY.PMSO]|uniref:hypothetical protein n=1 Tax=Rhizobium sp. SYY.PMSO TaxID=3382192 RepID=UPI00398FA32D